MNSTPRCEETGCNLRATHRLRLIDRAGVRHDSEHCATHAREGSDEALKSPHWTGGSVTPIKKVHAHRRNG